MLEQLGLYSRTEVDYGLCPGIVFPDEQLFA